MSSVTNNSVAELQELLKRLRDGDNKSYEELVRRYGGKMLSVAFRIVGDREEARDCVQDAFVQAFKNMDGFEGRSSLWTWLHRIVVNCSLLKLRSRRRRPEASLDELTPEFDAYNCRVEPRRQRPTVETLISQKEIRDAVRRTIEQLPEDYRSVVILRDIMELDTKETADYLGVTPGAVRTRLHRARAALKTLLESVIEGGPR